MTTITSERTIVVHTWYVLNLYEKIVMGHHNLIKNMSLQIPQLSISNIETLEYGTSLLVFGQTGPSFCTPQILIPWLEKGQIWFKYGYMGDIASASKHCHWMMLGEPYTFGYKQKIKVIFPWALSIDNCCLWDKEFTDLFLHIVQFLTVTHKNGVTQKTPKSIICII